MVDLSNTALDDRPTVEPDCFSWRPEGAGAWHDKARQEIMDTWRGKVAWVRWTIVNSEYPKPPYPHGLYFEGWTIAPHRMKPPHNSAPFNYPLQAESLEPIPDSGNPGPLTNQDGGEKL